MKRGIGFLASVLAVILTGMVVMQCRVVRHVRGEVLSQSDSLAEYEAPSLPTPGRLTAPHAILVLDVSGSMRTADPQHLQAEAALQFFRTYKDLAAEILRSGEQAKVAVVLFATVAQVVDWTGTGDPWLAASDAQSALFERVIGRYLGKVGEDPRNGQDTDYLAALDSVNQLVAPLTTPPAVVFLTDGLYDPHPLFSPLVPRDQREALRAAVDPRAAVAVRKAEAEGFGTLSAISLPPVFDTRPLGVSQLAMPPGLLSGMPAAVSSARSSLLARRFWLAATESNVCPLWTPVFLGAGAAPAVTENVRQVLSGAHDCQDWAGSPPFIHCEDPKDLVGEFIAVVARWFRLAELPIVAQSRALSLPVDTEAFAVSVRTEAPGSRLRLTDGVRSVEFQGRNGVWAGVASEGGGTWAFETDGGPVTSGRLYVRLRYDWFLHVPRSVSITPESLPLDIELLLFNLEEGTAVSASEIYGSIPDRLAARVSVPGQPTPVALSLDRQSDGSGVAYRGRLPVSRVKSGSVKVEVDLSAFQAAQIPVPRTELTRTIDLRPGLRVLVTDSKGRPTVVHVEGVPREGDALRTAWARIRGSWKPAGKGPDHE